MEVFLGTIYSKLHMICQGVYIYEYRYVYIPLYNDNDL